MNHKIKSFFSEPFVSAALVLSFGLILAALVGSYAFYQIRVASDTIVVTGSAKTTVTADSVKWSSSISRTAFESNLQNAYGQMARDGAVVRDFLTRNNIASSSVYISPIFVEQVYRYGPGSESGPTEYVLRQTVTVNSTEIQKIEQLARNTQEIINRGVIFSTQSPEYYYSKLADLRVSLLADAIKDAKARAEMLANSSGRRVGVLRSASSGVVQVLAPNSIDVSDYGQYDTGSIEKDVMITARATFSIR